MYKNQILFLLIYFEFHRLLNIVFRVYNFRYNRMIINKIYELFITIILSKPLKKLFKFGSNILKVI